MPTKMRLDALTSLRFFAAACIVVHHTHAYFGYGSQFASTFVLSTGVSFFYVLSGFILFYTYDHLGSRHETERFLVARFARIWPLHLFILLFMFLAHVGGSYPHPTRNAYTFLSTVLLLQAWIPIGEMTFAYNGPAWSISDELFFYAMFPLLAWRWSQTWPLKIGLAVCLVLGMGIIVSLAGIPVAAPWGTPGLSGSALMNTFPTSRLLEFAVGMGCAHLWRRHIDYLSGLSRMAVTCLEAAALAIAIASTHLVQLPAPYIPPAAASWVRESGALLSFGGLILAMSIGRGYLAGALRLPLLITLGEISFALYLCHEVLAKGLLWSHKLMRLTDNMLLQMLIYWAISLLAAWALWRYVEVPARRWILAKFDSIRGARPHLQQEQTSKQ